MKGENQFTVKEPNLEPSEELSYLLGVLKGDGCIYKTTNKGNRDKADYLIQLGVKDLDFAIAFNDTLEKIFFRKATIITIKNGSGKLFRVALRVKFFYKWYKNQKFSELCKIVEEYPSGFIRGFFDSEGSIGIASRHKENLYLSIRFANSNIQTLTFIKKLLKNNFNIESTIKKRIVNARTIDGRLCNFTKPVYVLGFYRKAYIETFFNEIGTSIKRKSMEAIMNGSGTLYEM